MKTSEDAPIHAKSGSELRSYVRGLLSELDYAEQLFSFSDEFGDEENAERYEQEIQETERLLILALRELMGRFDMEV